MRRFLRHDRSAALAPLTYEDAALHVRTYVAMATVDGDVRTGELECMVELVDTLGTVGTRGRLLALLRMLLDAPPFADDVLDSLAMMTNAGRREPALVRALQRIAEADGRVTAAELAFETDVVASLRGKARAIERIV